jgi:hypothetical protein
MSGKALSSYHGCTMKVPVKNSVVVNDRWGKETRSKHGGFYTTEYDLVHETNSQGTLKLRIPGKNAAASVVHLVYNGMKTADYNTFRRTGSYADRKSSKRRVTYY